MNRITCCFFATLFALILLTTSGYAHERNDGGYYTIVDEMGTAVYLTGRAIDIGDQFLTEQNKRYEVISIEGDTAHAKFIGTVNMSLYEQRRQSPLAALLAPKIANAQQKGTVAIYHTHTDESYVPTDGVESKLGAGSIMKVGSAFAESLEAKGIKVIHSKAKHDPHDNMAYERSRRTAMNLVKQKPSAIFDIHRDAVPPQVYGTKINGKDVSKVQLVVGKYGPTGKQIEDYALKIKAAADKQHPGLVKGIFFAKGGDYNQDLMPRSMLLEVGAHTNSLDSAERGIALFADVIPSVIGAAPAGQQAQSGKAGFGTAAAGPSGASKSIGWILGLLVVGVIAFLLLSTGSLKEAGSKFKQFTSTEFTNFLGSIKKRNKGRKDDDERSK